MRKTIAVLLFLAFLLAAATAPAEGVVRVESPTVADFGDFTLAFEPGALYIEATREAGNVYLVALPQNETAEDSELAFNVFWYGPFSTDSENIAAMRDAVMATRLASLESSGVRILSEESAAPAECFLQGKPCVYIDVTTVFELTEDYPVTAVQRLLFVGDPGYVFFVAGASPERLEESLNLMESMLSWK